MCVSYFGWYKFIAALHCFDLIHLAWLYTHEIANLCLAIKNVSPDLDIKVVWHVENKQPQMLIRSDKQGIFCCSCET